MPRKADPVTRYAKQVVARKVIAGEFVRLACQRHLNDLKEGKKRGLRWDLDAALRAINFFPTVLRHSKGEWAGIPVELAPWQQFRVGSVFGWKRADGLRRYRTAYNSVARKNGKSTEAAGIGLYMQAADGEGGAECYSYATKKDQARIVFEEAKSMVAKAPALKRRIDTSKLNLAMLETASKFEPLSADYNSLDGLNVHCAIGDEIHAHRNRELYDVIETAMGARQQPLHWCITTRGSNQEGICGELEDYAEKVLRGEVLDDSFFAYIACLDKDDEWDDPSVWVKANPNLGISVKLDRLEDLARKARHAPAAQSEFKRKHCNIWTSSDVGWIGAADWLACAGTFDADDLEGQECYGGLDLSGSKDLTAFVLVFPDIDGETDKVLPFFWLPEQDLEDRSSRDKADYHIWKEQGHLLTTPGASIIKSHVARQIADICAHFKVKAIGYDRWRIKDMMHEFDSIGFDVEQVKSEADLDNLRYSDAIPMVDWGQGFKDMSPAVDAIEGAILGKRLCHNSHPILTWCVSNVVLELDAAGNRKMSKRKALNRIDGAVAAAMAFGVKSRMAEFKPEPSAYETRGFLEL